MFLRPDRKFLDLILWLQARHNQKAQALEARLQQEIDQRHRDAAHFQGQIQYHIQHTQQLQVKDNDKLMLCLCFLFIKKFRFYTW